MLACLRASWNSPLDFVLLFFLPGQDEEKRIADAREKVVETITIQPRAADASAAFVSIKIWNCVFIGFNWRDFTFTSARITGAETKWRGFLLADALYRTSYQRRGPLTLARPRIPHAPS